MQTDIYTLPEITFVGGATQELYFNLKQSDGTVFDSTGCQANFAICMYGNKTGTPLISVTPVFEQDQGGEPSVLHATISSASTKSLFGKYIYQLTIVDRNGKVGIPNQGLMNITKNIAQTYLQQ